MRFFILLFERYLELIENIVVHSIEVNFISHFLKLVLNPVERIALFNEVLYGGSRFV